MPKRISYDKIDEKTFQFENKVSIVSNSTAYIRTNLDLANIIKDKRLKVTIEVLDG